MKLYLKIILIMTIFLLLNTVSVVANTSSGSKNKEIKASNRTVEILDIIEKQYKSIENLNKVGGIYFDPEGKLHLKFKKSSTSKNLIDLTNENAYQALLKMLGEENIVLDEPSELSHFDLEQLKNEVIQTIKEFHTPQEYINLEFTIKSSLENQEVLLEFKNFDQTLISLIKEKHGQMVKFNFLNSTISPTKGSREDWNQLGAGLGVVNRNGGACSTAGVASKNGNYFLITAAHCFTENTSSTGGDLFRQYSTVVGKQHADGSGRSLDVGLIRVEGSYLKYGRSATNKIKIYQSTVAYDAGFTNKATITTGVEYCKTGIKTFKTCGIVTYEDTSVKYIGHPEFKVAELSGAFSDNGDSGGAVYLELSGKYYLAGIVSGNRSRTINGVKVIEAGYVTRFSDVVNEYAINLYTSNTNYQIVN